MDSISKQKKRLLTRKAYSLSNRMLGIILISLMWITFQSPWWTYSFIGFLKLACVNLIYLVIYYVFERLYKSNRVGLYSIPEVLYSQILAFGFTNFILYLEYSVYYHRLINPLPILGVFIIEIIMQVPLIVYFHRLYMKFEEPKKAVIIYGSPDYTLFAEKMEEKIKICNRYQIIGCFPDTVFTKESLNMYGDCMEKESTSNEESLHSVFKKLKEADQIYLYDVSYEVRDNMVLYGEKSNKDIYLTRNIPDILTMCFDVSHSFDTPLIRTKRQEIKWYYQFSQRFFDILFSSVALIMFSPIFLVVGLWIKFTDKGPVFYKQTRLTKGHKEFNIIKFRSMVVDAEKGGKARLSSKNDDRITPVGKFIRKTRIDELPQLLNILRGDMSIVGPRPERPEIEKEYLDTLPEFGLRLKVKAGLTGYAQIFGKYNTTPSDKLKLDLIYINQRSVMFDLKLILLTMKIIFIPESTEGIKEGSTTALVLPSNKEE